MTTITDISAPSDCIAPHIKRWTRNRTMIEGELAVKSAGQTFLPKLPSQTCAEYDAWKDSVDFFPAAARALESHVGLIFRKEPRLAGADGFEEIIATISDRYTLDQFARKLVGETLTTNFTGVLVDSPEQPAGISQAQAEAEGYRPILALYRAESILEVEQKVVRNRHTLTRVRLLDDKDTVRELFLDDAGIYHQIIHTRTSSGWIAGPAITPHKNDAVQTKIPFRVVSTGLSCEPEKAPLDDICLLNAAHYRASANLNSVHRHIASPIRWITGLDTEEGEDDSDLYRVSPDSVWIFKSADTETGISEHSGNGASTLETRCTTIVDQMSAISNRNIAPDKAKAEAAETLQVRRAAEGSIMAAMALSISAQLEEMVRELLSRVGANADQVSYTLNTDFIPVPIAAQDVTAYSALVAAGRMSFPTFWGLLQAGEIVPDSIDAEDELERISIEIADRPPVDTGF